MSMLETLKDALTPTPSPSLDAPTQKKLDQARARHNTWKPYWAESLAFVEGRQFVFRSRMGTRAVLNELDVNEGGTKPSYKSRTVRNRIVGFWLSKISNGTQRIPSYQVTPTSPDWEVINAARLGEKVLRYLHTFLDIRGRMVEAYGYAIANGDGYLRPYWDPTAGDPLPADPTNPEEQLFTGELCLEAFGPHEVGWAAGCRFEESPFHYVERAQPIEYIKSLPGYLGGDLRPDAQGHGSFVQGQLSKTTAKGDMALLTEFLELPCKDYPKGRRFFIANNRPVTPEEPYPVSVKGPKGWEPCLVQVPYIPTPWRDRNMGHVEHMLDSQRAKNDAVNKELEWLKLALNPKVLAPQGSFPKNFKWTASPGTVDFYNPTGGLKPEIVNPPPIPQSLFQVSEQADNDMEAIASERELPAQVSSGSAESTFIENQKAVSQFIVQSLADAYGRLGSHLLVYVQEYYSEARLIPIEGRHATDFIPDFKGADLKDQTAVTVLPQSIAPRTREQVEQAVMNYAQLGWVSRDQAISAIENGTAEGLIEDYDAEVAKQQREIQDFIGLRNEQTPGGGVPQVAPWDNHQVHMDVERPWLQTREFESEPVWVQSAAVNHYNAHKLALEQEQMQQAQQMNLQAGSMGMQNAAKPQNGGSPLPSLPSLPGS